MITVNSAHNAGSHHAVHAALAAARKRRAAAAAATDASVDRGST